MESKPSRSRADILEAIERKNEAAQRNLLAKVEALEVTHGIPYTRLTDLYGDSVLDPTSGESKNIDRWAKLCDTLVTTDKAMVAMVGFRKELVHGCYGFGQEPKYDTTASIIIVTDPHEAKISFSDVAGSTRAYIEASGFCLIQPGGTRTVEPTFDDLTEDPQPIKEVIVATRSGFDMDAGSGDKLDIVVAGDTFRELYDAVENGCHTMDGSDESITNTIFLDRAIQKLNYAPLELRRKARLAAEAAQTNS